MVRVSVILPVYNGEPYLKDAVESILVQDFSDFELLAINDGSTDGSGDVLESFRDPRIRVIHQENRGLALTLRRGVEMTCGEYIARQDQDDVSFPFRFSKQVMFLDAHPQHGALGTGSVIMKDGRLTPRGHQHPTGNGAMQVMSLFDSYFVHSSVMLRREAVLLAGNYPCAPNRNPPEDFDLWSRMARICAFANLPEPMVYYRELSGSISRAKADLIAARVHEIACENISLLVGLPATDKVVSDLVAIVRGDPARLSKKPKLKDCAALTLRIANLLGDRFLSDRDDIFETCRNLRYKTMNNDSLYRLARTSLVRMKNWLYR